MSRSLLHHAASALSLTCIILATAQPCMANEPSGLGVAQLGLGTSYAPKSVFPVTNIPAAFAMGPHLRLALSPLRSAWDKHGFFLSDYWGAEFGLGYVVQSPSLHPFWFDGRLEVNLKTGYAFYDGNFYVRGGGFTGKNSARGKVTQSSSSIFAIMAAAGLQLKAAYLELGAGVTPAEGAGDASNYYVMDVGFGLGGSGYIGLRMEYFTRRGRYTSPLLNTQLAWTYLL
jgi:hypothetical protein